MRAHTPTNSPLDVKTGRGAPRSRSTLLPFAHGNPAFVAGLALCYGESINLTCSGKL